MSAIFTSPPENIGSREKNGKCTPKKRAHRSRTLVGMTFTQALAVAIVALEFGFLDGRWCRRVGHQTRATQGTTLQSALRITADPEAVAYLNQYLTPDGNLSIPVLTVHTTGDGVVVNQNEQAYASAVRSSGDNSLLRETFVQRAGALYFYSRGNPDGVPNVDPEVSRENPTWQHGAFTKALLDAFDDPLSFL